MKEPPARVIANGIPKSGTHLLVRAIERLGYTHTPFCLATETAANTRPVWQESEEPTWGEGVTVGIGKPRKIHRDVLAKLIRDLPNHTVCNAHCYYSRELIDCLRGEGAFIVNIIRDPRDIVLSLANYMIKHGHPVFRDSSISSAVDIVLSGFNPSFDPKRSDNKHFTIFQTFPKYMEWFNTPGMLVIRYEDLVGELGGENQHRSLSALKQLANHLRLAPPNNLDIVNSLHGNTRTFHNGRAGDWRAFLRVDQQRRLTIALGDHLQALAYDTEC